MLHAVIAGVAVGVLVGCSTPTHDDQMLSASRISIAERTTVRIHADVDSIADLTIEAPPTVAVVPVSDGVGPGFDVTPSCDAAPGADADLVVHVRDRKTGRNSAVVLAVIDDQSDACAATVSFWVEACATDPCTGPCTPSPGVSSIALAKSETARICMSAAALDSARPLTAESFTIEPATSAFEVGATSGTTRSIIVRGASWLVGPYSVRYSALASNVPINKLVPLDIGAPTDIGVEPPPVTDQLPVREFARTVLPIVVHRFPAATADCTISLETQGQSPFECGRTDLRLYDASGASVPRCTTMGCGPAAHQSFSIAYVPQIASGAQESIPIAVTSNALTSGSVILVDVTSRAENLSCTNADRIACADLDGDGVLDVVLSTSGGSPCIVELPAWRADYTQTLDAVINTHLVTIPRSSATPEILAIGYTGDVLHAARKDSTAWTWTPYLTGYGVPSDATPISSTGTVPDFLVGTKGISPAVARFVKLGGGFTEINLASDAPVGVGALTNGNHDDLGVANTAGSVGTFMVGSTLALDWSSGMPKTIGVQSATVNTALQPGNYYVVSRKSAPTRDLLLLAYNGPFATAVAEMQYSPASSPTLSLGFTYGSVRSVATTPEGDVLLGTSGGAQLTFFDPLLGYAKYKTVDPVPPTVPDAAYGLSVTACLDASGATVGYAWQTEPGRFRVTQPNITPETP